MTKQSGMGDMLFVDGYDISGDVNSVPSIRGGFPTWDVTPINKSAPERLGLHRDGEINHVGFFNDASSAPLGAWTVLKSLPMTDRQVSYFHTSVLGAPAASLISKQLGYDWTRAADGSFTSATNCQSNGFGLEWGEMLTPGKKTDTGAANGTGIDFGSVSTLFGWAAYLHVFAFTGTSVTVTLQDSADNNTYNNLTGGAFTAATGLTQQRLAGGTTATVRRYVRAITTGTFSNAVFAVNFVRYLTAQT